MAVPPENVTVLRTSDLLTDGRNAGSMIHPRGRFATGLFVNDSYRAHASTNLALVVSLPPVGLTRPHPQSMCYFLAFISKPECAWRSMHPGPPS